MTIKSIETNQSVKAAASLAESVSLVIENYLHELKGEKPVDLHKLVMDEIEAPLFKSVIEHCRYNQSRAATMLGISRGTLRTKLKKYFDDKYTGTREKDEQVVS